MPKQNQDVTTKQREGEIATLYQRQQATDSELVSHHGRLEHVDTELGSHHGRLERVDTELGSHHGRLEHEKGRLQNQDGSGAREITYEDIPALQGRLKHYYRTMCITVPNPVVCEELELDRLYVDPDIKVLRETTDPHTGLEDVQDQPTKANMSQCRQLFYSKDHKCRQIYITGDAGLGKSMFCKHLVDLWCKADSKIVTNTEDRDSESCDSKYEYSDGIFSEGGESGYSGMEDEAGKKRKEEDRRIMSEFNLLFYITLRESPDQYYVADMIDSQILKEDEEMQHLKASVLLKKVPCLVIIDGLDEWVCPADAKIARFVKPGIPDRDWLNTSNVFLTTTRPWKFDVLQLTSEEVDKHVELVGFNRNASITLCSKLTEVLKRKEPVQRIEGNLQAELRRKGLSHLSNIPVILTMLVCLWFDKQHLSESYVQLYCSMLEMLLKRADKNFPKQTCASSKEMQLPECFKNHEHCQTYHVSLVKLCKVAFEDLFNQKREQALVFESSQMGILGLDHIDIDLCLKSGILSQRKVLGKKKKLSFLHRQLQDFLAAVFITCENEESIISCVKQFCTSVESMLKMSLVWMFLFGMKYDLAKQLLADLMTGVVSKDLRLQQYRHTLEYPDFARSIQTCILECVIEATCNGHNDPCFPLEDFVINEQTISTCLERLLTFNSTAIKSVYIRSFDTTSEGVNRYFCQLQNTHTLQKLHVEDLSSVITNMQPICEILNNNSDILTSLEIRHITLTTASDAVCHVLTHVTSLCLFAVTLTHTQIEQLLSVVQAQHLKQLQLELYCADHADKPCRPGIDLSSQTQLQTLVLWFMYVEHLPTVIRHLKHVELMLVTIAENELRKFMHALSSTLHRLKVELDNVTVVVDLTDLEHNPKWVVSKCCINQTWSIDFKNNTFAPKHTHKRRRSV